MPSSKKRLSSSLVTFSIWYRHRLCSRYSRNYQLSLHVRYFLRSTRIFSHRRSAVTFLMLADRFSGKRVWKIWQLAIKFFALEAAVAAEYMIFIPAWSIPAVLNLGVAAPGRVGWASTRIACWPPATTALLPRTLWVPLLAFAFFPI